MPFFLTSRYRTRIFTITFVSLFVVSIAFQLKWFTVDTWSSVRLAPAFQMAAGQPLYPTASSGPYVMTLYGFLGPIFYLPFTWITNADWALVACGIWTGVC